MKKTVLCSLLAMVGGLLLGTLLGSGLLPVRITPLRATAASVTMGNIETTVLTAPASPRPALDRSDNPYLVECAGKVLEYLKQADYAALSTVVHPEKGLTLTPYSTVSFPADRTLTPAQVAGLSTDDTCYVWGIRDGNGTPIRLSGEEYFRRYVFNADYTQAPNISIDEVLSAGNALENAASAYPEGRFVEYYYPELKPEMEGYDWCSLKVVFEAYQEEWYLVGLIHSEWTA